MKNFFLLLLFIPCILSAQTEAISVSRDSLTKNKYIEGRIKVIGYSEKENFVTIFWKNIPILKRKVSSIIDFEIYFNFYEADNLTVKLERRKKSKVVLIIKSCNNEFIHQYTMGCAKQPYEARINGRP
jgi:hypothetical protein